MLSPNSAVAHNGLGLLAVDLNRPQDALKEFERAAAIDPNNASYSTNVGNARRAVGDAGGAEQAYRRALEVDPRAADAVNGLGVLLVETKRPTEAIPLFERAIAAVDRNPNSGLTVTGSNLAIIHRELIITLAARYKLPAVYPLGFFVTAGGLISYGPEGIDPHRRAAAYVDRILKGEKPGDLPVQAPIKYELVINLKTAKALGLTVPDTLLARADGVIE